MVEFSNPAAYEQWMGRWSKRLAPLFVSFSGLSKGANILDVGSGTGVLCEALLKGSDPTAVVGIEPAEDYVHFSCNKLPDTRVRFEIGDALNIPFEDDTFDATLSLLILQELADAPLALREMRRVTRPGGLVAASQWDFANGMPMLSHFWDTVLEVVKSDDARRAADDCMIVDYPDDAALRELWQAIGFTAIETQRQAVQMTFSSFEDYWSPFLSNVTPTSSYVSKLQANQASEIKKRLYVKLGCDSLDQSFCLTAHAWAIKGKVPYHN